MMRGQNHLAVAIMQMKVRQIYLIFSTLKQIVHVTRFMKMDPNHMCNLVYLLVYLKIFLYGYLFPVFLKEFKL